MTATTTARKKTTGKAGKATTKNGDTTTAPPVSAAEVRDRAERTLTELRERLDRARAAVAATRAGNTLERPADGATLAAQQMEIELTEDLVRQAEAALEVATADARAERRRELAVEYMADDRLNGRALREAFATYAAAVSAARAGYTEVWREVDARHREAAAEGREAGLPEASSLNEIGWLRNKVAGGNAVGIVGERGIALPGKPYAIEEVSPAQVFTGSYRTRGGKNVALTVNAFPIATAARTADGDDVPAAVADRVRVLFGAVLGHVRVEPYGGFDPAGAETGVWLRVDKADVVGSTYVVDALIAFRGDSGARMPRPRQAHQGPLGVNGVIVSAWEARQAEGGSAVKATLTDPSATDARDLGVLERAVGGVLSAVDRDTWPEALAKDLGYNVTFGATAGIDDGRVVVTVLDLIEGGVKWRRSKAPTATVASLLIGEPVEGFGVIADAVPVGNAQVALEFRDLTPAEVDIENLVSVARSATPAE